MRVWSWSNQLYTNFGYLKDSGLTNKQYMYLKYNSSQSYEFADDTGTTKMGFVCEAQGIAETQQKYNNIREKQHKKYRILYDTSFLIFIDDLY